MVRKVAFRVLCFFHGHLVLAEGGTRAGGRAGLPSCAGPQEYVVTTASAPRDAFTGTGMFPPLLHAPSDPPRGARAWGKFCLLSGRGGGNMCRFSYTVELRPC